MSSDIIWTVLLKNLNKPIIKIQPAAQILCAAGFLREFI